MLHMDKKESGGVNKHNVNAARGEAGSVMDVLFLRQDTCSV